MKNTWKPVTAGILNVISGVCCIIGAIVIISLLAKPVMTGSWASYVIYSIGTDDTPGEILITRYIIIMTIMLIVPGIIVFLGGVCAIRRRVWWLSLTGAILAIVYFPPVGLLAVILLALSKPAFIKMPSSQYQS